MKSYLNHLQSVQSIGETVADNYRPTFRSSAIFPVIHTKDYSSRILFMGYWMLKREIKEISLLYTLRDNKGKIVERKSLVLISPKAHNIELTSFEKIKPLIAENRKFTGSIELEIFSTRDLVFPYPAFVLNYYNADFNTVVHTTGRIYNDFEDLTANEEYMVNEAGFDIYTGPETSPFITFTNGPIKNEKPEIRFEIKTDNGKVQQGRILLDTLEPYETHFLELKKHIKLDSIIDGKKGTITLQHNFKGFFPRFIVGNFDYALHGVSITHSYYDCSTLNDNKSYWERRDSSFHDSAVSVPAYIQRDFFTEVVLYPIFSPSDYFLSLEYYDENGSLLKRIENYMEVKSSEGKYQTIRLDLIADEMKIDRNNAASVLLQCNWRDGAKVPTRVKYGLNVGIRGKKSLVPTNICFAPHLGNPNILKKQGTFRWAPLIDMHSSEIIITNGAPLKNYTMSSKLNISYYRESDETFISEEVMLAPNGVYRIGGMYNEKLKKFAEDSTCWVAIKADNPFVYGWYFDINTESGAVGGDHLF